MRTNLGRRLAREAPVDADVVVPVPDSGICAATGYADESSIPMRMGLIRNHYVGRTLIEPQQSIRHFGVKVKLNPVRNILEGRRVVLVDDSIVRGTTSRKIVRMIKNAGAREVHVRISCPPTISPLVRDGAAPVRRTASPLPSTPSRSAPGRGTSPARLRGRCSSASAPPLFSASPPSRWTSRSTPPPASRAPSSPGSPGERCRRRSCGWGPQCATSGSAFPAATGGFRVGGQVGVHL